MTKEERRLNGVDLKGHRQTTNVGEVPSCGSYCHWEYLLYRSLRFLVFSAESDFQSVDFKLIHDHVFPRIAFPPDVEHNQTWMPAGHRHRLVVNLPNSITLIRILCIPLLMWVLSSGRFSSVNGERELLASALFIVAAMTDGIDGYLARRRDQVTTIGILLDPIADKLLIAAAFITLVQLNPSLVPAWIAVVVVGREFLVSGLRSIAASEGFTIEASELGKLKMVVQIVSVVAVILDHRWKEWPVYGNYFFPIHWIAYLAIWFMVFVSLVSAIDYFVAFWSKIDRRVVKRRRRAFILSRRRKPVPQPQADRDVAAST